MSKERGAKRYTDPASGRPVIDISKDMLAAHLGKPRSKTAVRAESRWTQGAVGAGKGDMPRPRDKERSDEGWLATFCLLYRANDDSCECFECRNGR